MGFHQSEKYGISPYLTSTENYDISLFACSPKGEQCGRCNMQCKGVYVGTCEAGQKTMGYSLNEKRIE